MHQNKFIAPYHVYFDQSWHHAFQVGLALGFLGAFWIVLFLGAWLFNIIGLPFFAEIITKQLFVWIISPIVFVLGVHLTDSGSSLTRGARQLGLTLLSWLAILMTVILIAFVTSLPFTGVEKLFETKNTTLALLSSAAMMVLLINAAFQVGEAPKSSILRAIVRLSTFPLMAILGLAAYGLWLRIAQYGLTPARVIAGAELIILIFYGIGYLFAALKPGEWLVTIKPVNLACAWMVVGTLFMLMIPLGDPARVSVANQVGRLDKGKVDPNAFDFKFLANERSGQYGKKALSALSSKTGNERNQRIALLAQKAKEFSESGKNYYSNTEETYNKRRDAIRLVKSTKDWTGAPLLDEIPDEIILPSSKVDDVIGECLREKNYFDRFDAQNRNRRFRKEEGRDVSDRQSQNGYSYEGRCPARFIDVDFDGDLDFLIWINAGDYKNRYRGFSFRIFIRDENEKWRYEVLTKQKTQHSSSGNFKKDKMTSATDYMDKMRSRFLNLKPVLRTDRDFEVNGKRYRLSEIGDGVSKDEMRKSVEMLGDREVPEALLEARRLENLIAQCANGKNMRNVTRYVEKCYGRYFDIDENGVEEFLVIKFNRNFTIDVNAYAFKNKEWSELGSLRVESTMKFKSSNNRNKKMDRTIKSMKLLPPLTGDLEVEGQKIYLFPNSN